MMGIVDTEEISHFYMKVVIIMEIITKIMFVVANMLIPMIIFNGAIVPLKGTGMLFVSGLMVAIAVEHSNLHRRSLHDHHCYCC